MINILLEDISDVDLQLLAKDFGFKIILNDIKKNEEKVNIYITVFMIYKDEMHEFREYEYIINDYIYSAEYCGLDKNDPYAYKNIAIKYSRIIYRELFAQIHNIKNIDDWIYFISYEDTNESYLFKSYSFRKVRSYNRRFLYNHTEVDEKDKWIIDLFGDRFLNNEY